VLGDQLQLAHDGMRRLAMLPLRNASVSRLTSPWATVAVAQIASDLAEECEKNNQNMKCGFFP
jgi:hypothetical protein